MPFVWCTFLQSVLSLGFCEIRLRNSEQEQFDQWSREHPLERLLEISIALKWSHHVYQIPDLILCCVLFDR